MAMCAKEAGWDNTSVAVAKILGGGFWVVRGDPVEVEGTWVCIDEVLANTAKISGGGAADLKADFLFSPAKVLHLLTNRGSMVRSR